MMKMTKFKLALVAAGIAGLLASSAALAQAKYVWIDAQGVKQFSDTPPPGDIPEKNILKSPRRAAPAKPSSDSAAASSDAASADAAKPAPSLSDKEADYKKRKAEQAEKDKKAADAEHNAQVKADNCTHAKEYLAALNSGVRMRSVGADGQQNVMDDAQHAQETQRAQQAVNDSCNGG